MPPTTDHSAWLAHQFASSSSADLSRGAYQMSQHQTLKSVTRHFPMQCGFLNLLSCTPQPVHLSRSSLKYFSFIGVRFPSQGLLPPWEQWGKNAWFLCGLARCVYVLCSPSFFRLFPCGNDWHPYWQIYILILPISQI